MDVVTDNFYHTLEETGEGGYSITSQCLGQQFCATGEEEVVIVNYLGVSRLIEPNVDAVRVDDFLNYVNNTIIDGVVDGNVGSNVLNETLYFDLSQDSP
jgi:hypothetical protein